MFHIKAVIKQRNRINSKSNHFFWLIAGILFIILTVTVLFYHPSTYPFGDFTAQSTREDVKAALKLSIRDGSYDDNQYCKRKFYGLEGQLQIIYDDDDTLSKMNWYFECEKGKKLVSYSEDIHQIMDYFNELCGTPIEMNKSTVWKDTESNSYELELDEYNNKMVVRYVLKKK